MKKAMCQWKHHPMRIRRVQLVLVRFGGNEMALLSVSWCGTPGAL